MLLTGEQIQTILKQLLTKYHAEYALLFGSYARGEASSSSDLDVVVYGGPNFHARDILAFAEDLRELTGKEADVFEIRELNEGTPFYDSIMRDGVRIA